VTLRVQLFALTLLVSLNVCIYRLAPIVVGTSAIEVGIDFDTPSLIFEAHDSTAFIQRFGRGGRHHKCDTLCFIPVKHIPSLKKHLPNHPLGYNELKAIVLDTMPSPNICYGFVWSIQGAQIFYALLLSMNQYLIQPDIQIGYGSQVKNKIKQLKRQILDSKTSSPDPITHYLKEVAQNGNNEIAINALSKNMSVRSSLDSIP
jgi:CRISPR/Cas system-associated endonuclease/helicase Cas3